MSSAQTSAPPTDNPQRRDYEHKSHYDEPAPTIEVRAPPPRKENYGGPHSSSIYDDVEPRARKFTRQRSDDESTNELRALDMSFTARIEKEGSIKLRPSESDTTAAWLPISRKIAAHMLSSPDDEDAFQSFQDNVLRRHLTRFKEAYASLWGFPFHFAFEDGDSLIESVRNLGEGGFGIVDEVLLPDRPNPLVCVRKRVARPRRTAAHKKIMEAFIREVTVMARVDHHHCASLVGSSTDFNTLAIFMSPVADMDLAILLNQKDLMGEMHDWLRRNIGCICSALAYLHARQIRSVKPAIYVVLQMYYKVCNS